jgi:bifunctional non-homologous end joining protein LigD
VTKGPSLDPHDKRLAVEVEDDPLDYGDFEGTIPKGEYGGGTVQLWDRGYWEPEGDKTPEKALAGGDLKFSLDGKRLHGSWVLVRMKHDRLRGRTRSADAAGARRKYGRGSNKARELWKAAARRGQHEIAGGDESCDRRERRKYPFDEAFGQGMQIRRARLIFTVTRQKITPGVGLLMFGLR